MTVDVKRFKSMRHVTHRLYSQVSMLVAHGQIGSARRAFEDFVAWVGTSGTGLTHGETSMILDVWEVLEGEPRELAQLESYTEKILTSMKEAADDKAGAGKRKPDVCEPVQPDEEAP